MKLNFQQGEFFTALSNKEEKRFWEAVALYFGIIVVAIPVLAAKEYTLNKLGLLWRGWMTEHLMKLYFCHRKAFFRLSAQMSAEMGSSGHTQQDEKGLLLTIDNPDQRIVADVESFTKAALNFSVVFLGAGLRVASFGAILYNISGSLAVFLIVYSMAMTGAVTWLFGKRLAVLNFIQRKCEADLRFNLVRAREFAESIAMFDGGPREFQRGQVILNELILNNANVIWTMFGYEAFQNGTQYLTGLLPAVLVAPQYLAGVVEFGVVKQVRSKQPVYAQRERRCAHGGTGVRQEEGANL